MQQSEPTGTGPSDRFIGDVWIDRLAGGEPGSRIRVNVVRFAPGARTAWHSHAVGQTLHVMEGIGRVQSRGEPIVEVRAGDTVSTPADEWHWHGAAPERFMTHLAMWEAPESGEESSWAEQVTDEEYAAAPRGDRRDQSGT